MVSARSQCRNACIDGGWLCSNASAWARNASIGSAAADRAGRAGVGGRRLRPAVARRTRTAAGSRPAPAARAGARTLRRTAAGRARPATARTGSPRRGRRRARTAPPRTGRTAGCAAAARLRSSSGSSSTSPSAIRSITAISSVSASRSAPATGTCSCLRFLISSSWRMPRRGSRIMMSPERIGARWTAAACARAATRRSARRSPGRAAFPRAPSPRARPAAASRRLPGRLDLDQRPDLDQAGRRGPKAFVGRPAGVADHAVSHLRLGEHGVDQIEDRLGRAEGAAERLFAPRLPAAARTFLECLPEPTVGRHVGALHAHDRLFLVADHEQGAPQRRAPSPVKNSAHSASMIAHCSGLVSCPSSTRR